MIPATQPSTVVVGVSGVIVVCTVVSSAVVETSVVASLLIVSSDVSSTDSIVVPSEDLFKVAEVVADSASSDEDEADVDNTEVSDVELSTLNDVVGATSSMLDGVSLDEEYHCLPFWFDDTSRCGSRKCCLTKRSLA